MADGTHQIVIFNFAFELQVELRLLIAFDVIFLTISFMTFDYVVEE